MDTKKKIKKINTEQNNEDKTCTTEVEPSPHRRRKISKSWISNFLSNVLGVIVGIAITFGVSYLVQRHNEKQDTKRMMMLIKEELGENKEWLQSRKIDYLDDYKAYQKILIAKNTGNLRNIPADSLVAWIVQTREQHQSFVGGYAWEIFKNSETITKFDNKNLTITLTQCYHFINMAIKMVDKYYKAKGDASTYLNYETSPYNYRYTISKQRNSNILHKNC
jgi:hypothetical protein